MQARCVLRGSAQAPRAVPGGYPVRHRKSNQNYPTNQPTNQIPGQGPKLSNQPKAINQQKPFGRPKGTRSTKGYLWAGPTVILPTNRNPSEGPREPAQPS